eukprot:Ihof_evm3s599 gene=Ihof_evmTU3s599
MFTALAYLHAQGTLHGDIIPTNVLVDKEGNVRLSECGVSAPVHDFIQSCDASESDN